MRIEWLSEVQMAQVRCIGTLRSVPFRFEPAQADWQQYQYHQVSVQFKSRDNTPVVV